jgi:aldehyde dehydrogenase (NAD+)
MEVQKKIVIPSVSEVFSTMSYGPAPESDKVAQAWLDDHNRKFGHFINNEWVHPEGRKSYATSSPADGKVLAETVQGIRRTVHSIHLSSAGHYNAFTGTYICEETL